MKERERERILLGKLFPRNCGIEVVVKMLKTRWRYPSLQTQNFCKSSFTLLERVLLNQPRCPMDNLQNEIEKLLILNVN